MRAAILRPGIGLLAGLALLACAQVAEAQPPAVARAWLQRTEAGAELRLVTPEAACPTARVDGREQPMRRRAEPTPAFPDTVCALPLPEGARLIEAAGETWRPAGGEVRRIVVFGDTGCRVLGRTAQACDDPRAWPFATVARLAAAQHPDLVLHVGDYLYRESPCPAGQAGCAGQPHGDTWAAWDADLFAPAAPLLAAAPWVFVRGNHESCARAATGWFRLLDAAPTPPACPAGSAPWSTDLGGGLALLVIDGTGAQDVKTEGAAAFRADLKQALAETADRRRFPHRWIATHRPIWGLVPVHVRPLPRVYAPINAAEQAGARGLDLDGVDLVVSGHIHEFEALTFGPARPAQLVVGSGGDVSEPAASPAFEQRPVSLDGLGARRLQFARFGYLVLDRMADGWSGAFHDIDDQVIASCALRGRDLACTPAER